MEKNEQGEDGTELHPVFPSPPPASPLLPPSFF